MRPHIRQIVWFALTVVGVVAQDFKSQNVEIDVIFPRNLTYRASDNFPIVLAIQNFAALDSYHDFVIGWHFMPYKQGLIPGGIWFDSGYFTVPSNRTGPVILVDTSNVTDWIRRKERREQQYMFQYSISLNNADKCFGESSISGHLMLSIETQWERDLYGANGTVEGGPARIPDVMDVPECPVLGAFANVTLNKTSHECMTVVSVDASEATPCAVKVDKQLVSSISSQASSIAEAKKPTLTTIQPTPTSSNIGAAAAPLQTALAIGLFVGGVVLAESC